MTTREVILDGGSPWGFRMHGGIDVLQSLRISRVNPGSKAAIKGIREGDIITSINNQSTRDINNADAHSLLKKSGDILKLGLNEDCSGSPKRRQYNKFLNQEGSTEKIECTSKSNYTSSTLSTINHNQFDLNDLQKRNFTNINGLNETNGAPENGVISQVSTLSSNCSSNSSAGSLIADPQGNQIRQEGRETAALYNVTENSTKLTGTKPVSADNEVNILIANSDMGGNSRSNKKRSRTNRKISKNSNIVTTSTIVVNEMMVNVPSSSSNSDITEHKNDIKICESNNSIKSDTDNDEIQTICANKLFECVQTNYRVESPNEVAIKPIVKASNGIVKSRSLDNDDLEITELSSEASEGEDKAMTECNAVVSETDSDVEWEVTEDISNSTQTTTDHPTIASIAPEDQLDTVQVTLITAEEERSLRSFLDGLKLVTSPEEAISLTQKRESYKERKARKRAAIAEHFIPILEQPRYLEVISEESNDTSDKDQTDSNTSSRLFKKEGMGEKYNVEGTWKTCMAESSSLKAEIVYIDDSSNSDTSSGNSDTEENEDADAEESRSENVSLTSSNQDVSKNAVEVKSPLVMDKQVINAGDTDFNQKILEVTIPSSQLTPPPTPDLLTPTNETVCLENELNEMEISTVTTNILQEDLKNEINSTLPRESIVSLPYEDEFNKEFHGFCEDLNVQYPCKYSNAVSPLAISRSSSVSSEGSSRTQSQRTVRLNSTCSSIADVADLLKDYEYAKDTHTVSSPKTLKEMCLNKVISLPFGSDVLEELADVSKSMENLTMLLESKISPRLSNLSHQFSTKKQSTIKNVSNDINFNVPVMKEEIDSETYTKWVALPTEQDPRVLMCLSPTQKSHLETTKREFDEAGRLLQLHEKFINRRGYNEGTHNNRKMPENVEITVLSNDSEANNASKASKFSNRLLAIIRESSDAQPISYLNVNNENVIHTREPYLSKSLENLHGVSNMETRLINTFDEDEFSEHYENVINTSHHFVKKHDMLNIETTGSYQSEPASYESRRVQSSCGNTPSFTNIPNRRFSLPQEFYQRQMHYIREKEKEIQDEIEKLEKEKTKMMQEMDETPLKYFEADKYCISRKGDIAIHNDEIRSQKIESQKQSLTLPAAPTEFFRQQMYDEYMLKIAARQERKLQKVIKITSSPSSQVGESTNSNNMCDVVHVSGIEDEFMNKVNERMLKFGLKRDNSDEVKNEGGSAEDDEEPILVIDGDSLKEVKVLPKHLQEFLDLTRQGADASPDDIKDDLEGRRRIKKEAKRISRALSKNRQRDSFSLLHEIDSDLVIARGFLLGRGVWSPGQKSLEDKYRETIKLSEVQKSDDETIIPVWTPRSAGSSPTLERKEFRPVNFESPTLKRKNIPKSEVTETPDSPSAHPPWQVPESSGKVGVSLSSSLERRLPTSHSAPASGFTEFSSSRLPKAQNPTITLLQKAREGQLPRGASYLPTEHSHRNLGDKPPHIGPGEILYQVRREYTSKSDNEIPRRMADLGSRKYEVGIGPTTKDGMPLVLRSEVKDGNQSRWYKRMYETIHKQKPDRDYVTVRYKQRRARYPYLSGYFSEPEQSAFSADYYDSDGTVSDSKYATLDRRRLQETINGKENEYISCTLPKSTTVTRRQTEDAYRNQPGRIENYIPGHSSISEKEAKEWWDEVMDIFDGHLEQQKNIPQPRGHMSKALKESGYESDSTLLFRKREEATQHLSPLEHKEAYKTIQKGGEVPLHGLRKPAPERPKESTHVEYISISPTPIRIRNQYVKPQNQVYCYPLSVPPHPRHVFADYKRTAPTSFPILPKSFPNPPSPPKRLSSKNSTTLRLISNMKERTEKSPISKRHETCFTSNSKMEKHKVNYLKDKITTKLNTVSKKKFESESKLRSRDIKTASVAPSIKSSSFSSKLTPQKAESSLSKSSTSLRSLSASPCRRITKGSSQNNIRSTSIAKVKPGTFGTEKRKVDLSLPRLSSRSKSLSKSTELLSPTEVKKAVISQINSLNTGPVYRSSCALYSSAKNGAKLSKDKILPIQVGFSERGKELLKSTRPYNSLPGTPVVTRSPRRFVPSPSPSEKSKSSSQSSLYSKSTLPKNSKPKTSQNEVENKKLRKSRKDQLNGEIAKRVKKATVKPMEKQIPKSSKRPTTTQNIKQLNRAELEDSYEQLYHLTQDVIQKQKEAIQSNSFFQHLFLDDASPPTVSVVHPHSRITEKTRMLQRKASSVSEPSIGALKIYLNHTKPVSDSKFKSLDAAIMRSRSASPKSVTWKMDGYLEDKYRSLSLPPRIVFSETSRPISPTLIRKQPIVKPSGSTKLVFAVSPTVKWKQTYESGPPLKRSGSTSKLIFSETSRPVSPIVTPKIKKSFSHSIPKPGGENIVKSKSPARKLYFSETSRPTSPVTERRGKDDKKFCSTEKLAENTYSFSPVLERRIMPIRVERCRSSSPSAKLFFSETSRPVSPLRIEKCRSPSPSTKLFLSKASRSISPLFDKSRTRSESPIQKMYFSETSRPVSPVIERKFKVNQVGQEYEYERSYSPSSKLFFSETSRPVSPVIQRKYANEMNDKNVGKVSHLIEISSEVKPSTLPIVHREHCDNLSVSRSPSYRKITQAKSSRFPSELKIFRSRSADAVKDLTSLDDVDSLASVDLSQEQKYVRSFHSPRSCAKFKELNNFYSTLERMNELERTTSSHELRPRRKNEDEIIGFERWKEVHVRERAEKELEKLYGKLKNAEQEKGFLFQPKDVERYRWKKELDRGLRIKDKSVNNIRESFEKLKDNSYKSDVNVDERIFNRDLYKPLWRGNSVVDLASNIVERRSQSEGRVKSDSKKFQVSEKLLTRGIGSRIWSSLSSEQINLLKGQLAEIYSQNGNTKSGTDYNVSVPIHKKFVPKLSVRRNSEEYFRKPNSHSSIILSENEKKKLSQDLSREVLNRASKRKSSSVSLVVGKEMRGAIAVADAGLKSITPDLESPRTCYSLEVSEDEKDKNQKDSNFLLVLTKEDGDAYKNDINKTMQNWAQPKKALVSTDATNRVTSMSETESGSTDESTKTVIHLNKKDDVLKKVEYFEHVAEEQPYTPIIYRASENYSCDAEIEPNAVLDLSATQSEDFNQPRKLISSQSYQDFKELFGEQEQNKFSTPGLAAAQLASHCSSTTSLKSTNGISMKFNEVEHLKNKFEHMEDFYSHRLTSSPRRCRSNPELTRKEQIIIPGQIMGEVDHLRRKYEYPWIFGRGRSRIRRGGVVSPVSFPMEDRYMPHINIISKIASLYPKKTVFLSDVRKKSVEELAKILGCPLGEVERIRKKFESPERGVSLLGHMFTSSPSINELRDISPYLTASWTAHKYPKIDDNTRSLSSPDHSPSSWNTELVKKQYPRPKSTSPVRSKVKLSPILKNRHKTGTWKQNSNGSHQHVSRPSFEPVRYKPSWSQTAKPTVTFKGVVF